MTSVPTLESLSAVKVAIAICTNANVKKELFRTPESSNFNLDLNMAEWLLKEKGSWDGVTQSTVANILQSVFLPDSVLKILSFHVHVVVQDAWKWFRYLNISHRIGHDYCTLLLKPSLFTSSGRLDRRAVASQVARDKRIRIPRRCKLAFLFLPPEDVIQLWRQMDENYQYMYSRVRYCEVRIRPRLSSLVSVLARATTNCITDGFDANCTDELWTRLFEGVVEHGSVLGVKYYWQKLDPNKRHQTAVKAFNKLLMKGSSDWEYDIFYKTYWAECIAEVLSFLLSQMEDDQKVSILQKDLEWNGKQTVLINLLNRYSEDGFLDMVKLSWSFLRESDFHSLLQRIVLKILCLGDRLKCPYVTSCDYRKILREFWKLSPITFKRDIYKRSSSYTPWDDCFISLVEYVDDDDDDTPWNGCFVSLVECSDVELIAFLLEAATLEEKLAVMFYGGCFVLRHACKSSDTRLANDLLDCISPSQTEKQKHLLKAFDDLPSHYSAASICDDPMAFYNFVDLCLQFEHESTKADLRKEVVRKMSNKVVEHLLVIDRLEEVDGFLQWCFSTPEQIHDFKTEFLEKCSPEVGFKLVLLNHRRGHLAQLCVTVILRSVCMSESPSDIFMRYSEVYDYD